MTFTQLVHNAVSIANLVKILIVMNTRKRLPIKQASDNKIATYFDQLVSCPVVPKPKGLTLGERDDGMGAQLHAQLSLICLSKLYAIPYVHQDIEDAAFVESDEEYIRWNSAFNLASASDHSHGPDDTIVRMEDYVSWPFGKARDAVLSGCHVHRAAESHLDDYASICQALSRNLQFEENCADANNKNLIVALHVRRGDVSDTENSKRYTTLGMTKRTVAELIAILEANNLPFQIELHSQGTEEDFQELLDEYPMTTYLNSDPLATMGRLINADILVTAKSSFSHIAAMLSEGEILYQNFWHKPFLHWHQISNAGSIDEATQKHLAARLNATHAAHT